MHWQQAVITGRFSLSAGMLSIQAGRLLSATLGTWQRMLSIQAGRLQVNDWHGLAVALAKFYNRQRGVLAGGFIRCKGK
ncbi:MAG: hypothetical protein K8953_07345 [Proteobacteria bacterium]|nr:hypothetical protein [Pseudomonadota bacterium]